MTGSSTLPSPSRRRLLLALAALFAIAVGALSFALDGWSRDAILAGQGKGWKKTTAYQINGAISNYGDWPEIMLVAVAGLFVAIKMRNARWQRILVTAMVASTLAGILANSLRLTTGRTRPRESPKIEQGWHGPFHDGKITIGNSKYNSFPSGHTATAMGFAAVLFLASPVVGIPALLAACAIAWSRMALGAHHLSDVTVATLLAFAVAWFCWSLAQRRGEEIADRVLSRFRRKP